MSVAIPVQPGEISQTRRAQSFYRPELDGLRFFAFFCVFIHHTLPTHIEFYLERHIPFGDFITSVAEAGRFGVDLFFVLSAYLITELLLREKENFGKVHLKSFYLRRMLRIWPLYFLAIAIATFLPHIDSTQTFPLRYVVAFLFLAGNWIVSFYDFPESVMNALWSVSFEEQFYLFWPAVIALVRRARTLGVVACGFLIVSMLSRVLLLKYSQSVIWTNSFARLDPLAVGVLSAVILRSRHIALSGFARLGLAGLGAVLWVFAGHFEGRDLAFMVLGYPVVAVGAGLIFMAVWRMRWVPRWLRYCGKISYGLYVFHMLGLYIARKLAGDFPHNFRQFFQYWSLGLTVTFVLAAFSYAFFESPFLRMKERFAFVKSRPV